MKNKMKIMALAATSVLVFSCSKSSEVAEVVTPVATTAYNIAGTLNTANEPRSANTGAVTGTYDWASKKLTITVTHTIAAGKVTMGHLHIGDNKTNGTVIFPFVGALNSPVATQTFTLDATQDAALQAGNLYVNLHSSDFPKGEIRGQLAVAAVTGVISATLSGANEIIPSTATGAVTGTYDSATKALSITTTYALAAVAPATTPDVAIAAHIHTGLAGASGGVILPFVAPLTSPTTQTKTLTAAEEADLMKAGLYVNIHSASYPNGEIRGQLIATKK